MTAAAAVRLALVLPGGGARGAYQAGVLERLGEAVPELEFPLLCGVSAGAINAAYLANSPGTLGPAARALSGLWASLRSDQVIRGEPAAMVANVARWGTQLLSGGIQPLAPARGLLDTAPLRSLLERALSGPDGVLSGVPRKLAQGRLQALAITTTSYATGTAITFVQQAAGEQSPAPVSDIWSRPQRVGRAARIEIDHVLASAAIPLLFPAVRIEGSWHGDGSIRDTAPLAAPLHLGADRILLVSTVRRPPGAAAEPGAAPYPSLARIVGVTLNSLLYGHADHDAEQLRRFTELARTCPGARAAGIRPVELCVLRPSRDLGEIAAEYEHELPRAIRYLTRGLGTREPHSTDLLSALSFEAGYSQHLIECGRRDAEASLDELLALVRPGSS